MDIGGIAANLLTGGGSGLLSALAGGVTGFIGGIFRQRHDRKMKEIELKEKQIEIAENDKDRQFQLDVMDKEAENAEKIAKIQFDEKKFTGDMNALMASIKADQASYSKAWAEKVSPGMANIIGLGLGIVDTIRGLIRPGITLYLVYLMADIWKSAKASLLSKIATDEKFAAAFSLRVTDMIMYLTGLSVGWWFGSRPTKPPRQMERK